MDGQKETLDSHSSKSSQLLDRLIQLSIKLRRSARELTDITGDLTCSLQDLEVLVQLALSGQVSSAQLQRRLVLTSGALAHRLDKMETAGHIRRVRTSLDRRQVQVEVTPQGVAELRRVEREQMHDDMADALRLVERRLRDE